MNLNETENNKNENKQENKEKNDNIITIIDLPSSCPSSSSIHNNNNKDNNTSIENNSSLFPSNDNKDNHKDNNKDCYNEKQSDIYIVNDGETLIGIALKLNININTLKRFNNINSNVVFPGQVLKTKIPQRGSSQGDENSRPNKNKTIITNIEELQSAPLSSKSTNSSQSPSQLSSQSQPKSPTSSSSTPSNSSKSNKTPTSTRVSQYISSFFWKSNGYNNIPTNSPSRTLGKTIGNGGEVSSENDSSSPPQVAEFEKDENNLNDYIIDFSNDEPTEEEVIETNKNTKNQIKSNTLHVIDKEFDAEFVELDIETNKKKNDNNNNNDNNDNNNISNDNFIPVLSENGHILKHTHLLQLVRFLPIIIQHHSWRLLYSVLRDGADFSTFYNRVRGHKITLVVIEALNGQVFGGLATEVWHIDTKFYGSGNAFIFHIVDDCVLIYPWTLQNDFIMWSSATQIAMGGGGSGFGFLLDDDFLTGQSNHSQTFDNPPLTGYLGSFRVVNVEIWGFDSII